MLKILIMKPIIFSILFCASLLANAQYSWTDAVLTMEDGKVKTGQVKLPLEGNNMSFNFNFQRLKFRSGKKSKAKKIKAQAVKDIVFTINYKEKVNGKRVKKTKEVTYVPIVIKRKKSGKETYRFMEEIVKGPLSLYGKTVTGSVNVGMAPYNPGVTMTHWYNHNQLYFKKGDELPKAFNHISLSKSFKNRVIEYVKECPTLVTKLSEKEFKKEDMKEIAEFYNSNCGS